jgi:type I restriction enzyme S subunit
VTELESNLPRLPQSWGWAKIGDFTEVLGGKRLPKGHDFSETRTDHPYIRVTDFESMSINQHQLKFLEKKTFELIKKYTISKDDVYISIAGSIGKIGTIPDNLNGASLTENAAKILANQVVEKKALSLFLNSTFAQKQIKKSIVSTNQPKLALFRIEKILVPIPPRKEQARIISKVEELFSFLDAGVASLHAVQAQLKRYRQAVLKYAFEGKLTEKWRTAHKDLIEPAQKTLEAINKKMNRPQFSLSVSPVLPKLPEEWAYCKLGDICASVEQVNPRNEPTKEITYLEIASIDSNQRITAPTKYIGKDAPSRARQLVRTGDILFSTVRTYLRHIALVDAVFNNQIASTGFCIIRPLEPINSIWLFNLVQTNSFLNPLTKIQRGTSYPAVRNSDVFDQIIPFAPIVEQDIIAREIEKHLSQADETQQSIEKSMRVAENLRQRVLKNAFEGKLVFQNPNDEPAEKLLERIKTERLIGKSKNNSQVELSEYVK